MSERYTIQGRRLFKDGRPHRINGINLGNWLNLEDFMLGIPGTDWQMRATFRDFLGEELAGAFLGRLEAEYVTEADFAWLAAQGFNLVRLPINYRRLIADHAPDVFIADGFRIIGDVLDWAERHGMGVLLDLHAAPGGQNNTPPADNTFGYALLWTHRVFQDQAVRLWEELARRFHAHPALFGYNLLNEPVTNNPGLLPPEAQMEAMNRLNHRLLGSIRAIDGGSPVVISGPLRESGGLSGLDPALFEDPATMASYHHYPTSGFASLPALHVATEEPPDPSLGPGDGLGELIEEAIRAEVAFARLIDRPVLLGEFGFFSPASPSYRRVIAPHTADYQFQIVAAQLRVNEAHGFHWCLWSYKDVGLMGLMTPRKDCAWRRFVEDPARRERHDGIEAKRAALFEDLNTTCRKTPELAETFNAAWNEGIRAIRRAALTDFMRDLAEWPREEILRFPDCFSLRHCVIAQDNLRVLREFLRSAGGE